jgi:hypothetical protein
VKAKVKTSPGVGLPGGGGLGREQGRFRERPEPEGLCERRQQFWGKGGKAAGGLERHGPAEQAGALGDYGKVAGCKISVNGM